MHKRGLCPATNSAFLVGLTNLFEALVDFIENASLVEHLSPVTMLIVVGDVVA